MITYRHLVAECGFSAFGPARLPLHTDNAAYDEALYGDKTPVGERIKDSQPDSDLIQFRYRHPSAVRLYCLLSNISSAWESKIFDGLQLTSQRGTILFLLFANDLVHLRRGASPRRDAQRHFRLSHGTSQ